ncbi:16S rRNA (uracil(1498)-N(3))-methyltransferase [Opitutus sp. ER46]|uniref:16S rRNA (uracil(1498)-N(3))-methyltransferase n=1 Tax=Opitutus sp. ER46 TaxID=2161864 RepID=UPI000D313691|nr:16S rRNA (uracil(1498)-N(3))-methyltransferase [Opitutus sp. ER46]PTX92733.1 16S rRNA (uracil(1498)-N(3))-methyltransferase [Opitutus sp. ER46]
MPDFRAYCRPATAEPTTITLSADESHHLVTVNRAREGDTVVVFDGTGSEWICELTSTKRSGAELKVRFKQKIKPLPYEITLGQALPKGPGMDAIVRKATELGTARIVPLESERTQVHFDDDRSDKKIEKWQTAALEAAKQCGNAFLPEVQPVQNATAFIEAARGYDLKLIASLQPGAKSLKSVLAAYATANGRAPKRVVWLVGPEGDFTPAEMSQAKSAGFEPITLGPLVLRCETAAVYALSVLSYELQNA